MRRARGEFPYAWNRPVAIDYSGHMHDELPEPLRPLAGLIGNWSGGGHGDYPTIDPFDYDEQAAFVFGGKPILAYSQKTWHADDGSPLHTESGFLRPQPDGHAGRIEVVLAQPTGHAELLEGTLEGDATSGRMDLESITVVRTQTAKSVTATQRRFEWDSTTMRYEMAMAAVEVELTRHLQAELRRVR